MENARDGSNRVQDWWESLSHPKNITFVVSCTQCLHSRVLNRKIARCLVRFEQRPATRLSKLTSDCARRDTACSVQDNIYHLEVRAPSAGTGISYNGLQCVRQALGIAGQKRSHRVLQLGKRRSILRHLFFEQLERLRVGRAGRRHRYRHGHRYRHPSRLWWKRVLDLCGKLRGGSSATSAALPLAWHV